MNQINQQPASRAQIVQSLTVIANAISQQMAVLQNLSEQLRTVAMQINASEVQRPHIPQGSMGTSAQDIVDWWKRAGFDAQIVNGVPYQMVMTGQGPKAVPIDIDMTLSSGMPVGVTPGLVSMRQPQGTIPWTPTQADLNLGLTTGRMVSQLHPHFVDGHTLTPHHQPQGQNRGAMMTGEQDAGRVPQGAPAFSDWLQQRRAMEAEAVQAIQQQAEQPVEAPKAEVKSNDDTHVSHWYITYGHTLYGDRPQIELSYYYKGELEFERIDVKDFGGKTVDNKFFITVTKFLASPLSPFSNEVIELPMDNFMGVRLYKAKDAVPFLPMPTGELSLKLDEFKYTMQWLDSKNAEFFHFFKELLADDGVVRVHLEIYPDGKTTSVFTPEDRRNSIWGFRIDSASSNRLKLIYAVREEIPGGGFKTIKEEELDLHDMRAVRSANIAEFTSSFVSFQAGEKGEREMMVPVWAFQGISLDKPFEGHDEDDGEFNGIDIDELPALLNYQPTDETFKILKTIMQDYDGKFNKVTYRVGRLWEEVEAQEAN